VASRLGGIGKAFSDRNFRIYSVGSITSWISYFVQNITFSCVAWDVTHSTTWLAIVSAATTVTTVLLLPLGGVLADRHDRLRILMGAYALDWMKSAVLAALALTGHLKPADHLHQRRRSWRHS
jgi:MFS family permease